MTWPAGPRQKVIGLLPTMPTRASTTFFVALCALPSAAALSTLVYGPGSLEIRLLAAKLIAREPDCSAAFYVGEDNPAVTKRCRQLLYGKAAAEDQQDPENAQVLTSTEDLGSFLAKSDSLCLVCDSSPLSDGVFKTLLANAPDLSRVVLVSKMGVTRAKPLPFGLPNPDVALADNEKAIADAARTAGLELSIVRVGTLKGGGPGAIEDGKLVGDVELGLAQPFYDGIGDLSSYMVATAFDKFTLGAKLVAGDPFELANPIMRAGNAGSFDPRDDETSRIVAGGAIVHALCRHPTGGLDVTVAAAKGEAPPTADEWAELFAAAA